MPINQESLVGVSISTKVLLFTTSLVALSLMVGSAVIGKVKVNETQRVKSSLSVIQDNALNTYKLWFAEHQRDLARLARDDKIITWAEAQLLALQQGEPLNSSYLTDLRNRIGFASKGLQGQGFFIIAPSGISIASMRDENLGTTNLIYEQAAERFQQVLKGDDQFIGPLLSDVSLTVHNDANHKDQTAFFATAIQAQGQPIAVLARRVAPQIELQQLVHISDSLRGISVLGFSGDGSVLFATRSDAEAQPIENTEPADAAIKRMLFPDQRDYFRPPTNTYINHIGQEVLAVGRWFDDSQVGIIVEKRYEFAMEGFRWLAGVVAMLIAILIGFVVLLAYLGLKSNNRAMALLQDANANLENLVIARTTALTVSAEETDQALNDLKNRNFVIDQHAIVSITDLKGTITYANPAFERVSGYSQSELIGQNHRMLSSGTHDKQFWKAVYKTLAQGDVWKGPICNRNKFGDLYWVDSTIAPLKNKQGKVENYISIRSDITELKKSQASLKQASFRLELAAREAGIGVWDFNWQTEQFTWDANMYLLYELEHREFDGSMNHWAHYLHPEDKLALTEAFHQCQREGESFSEVSRIVMKDGRVKHIRTVATVTKGPKDELLTVGVNLDISEVVQAAELNRKRADELGRLNSRLADAERIGRLWSWQLQVDDGGVRCSSNTAYLYGLREEQLPETLDALYQLFTDDTQDGARKLVERVLVEGRRGAVTVRRHNTDGSELIEHMIVEAQKDEQERIISVSGVVQDITEQKMVESELKLAIADANAASQAKSEFLAMMSHEIRTPLNGVMGMLSIVLNRDLESSIARRLKIAEDSATSLLAIINDILDFSKIEAGKLEMETITFSVKGLVDAAVQSLKDKAHEKGLHLMLNASGLSDDYVMGDPGRIRQILVNILGNTIKFTHEGEITVTAKMRLMAETQWISVTVKDTGIGFDESRKACLFDSFSQMDTSNTRQYGGTGLGLAICKRLIDQMNGKIEAKLNDNEPGSSFSFRIPLACDIRPEYLPKPAENTQRQLNVAVIDDSDTNREIFEQQLAKWGMQVTGFASAEEFLVQWQQAELFDLLIIDSAMPLTSGLELGQTLANDPAADRVKKLMISSSSGVETLSALKTAGFHGFLNKPAPADVLRQAIDAVMDSSGKELVTEAYLGCTGSAFTPEQYQILLVEDNAVNAEVAMDMLSELGVNCSHCENGQKALEELQSQPAGTFSLILMDCQMPVLNGYEATEAIRAAKAGEAYAQIPIIALTARAMEGDQKRCLEAGMSDYIAKPFSQEVLKRTVMQWLQS